MKTRRSDVCGLTVDCGLAPEAGIEQLARLVRWHFQAHELELAAAVAPRPPLLVGISGSVAAGKTTLAHAVRDALQTDGELRVAVVGTDGFLLPDSELTSRGILHRKGFPDTYDDARIEQFSSALRTGSPTLSVPLYCHRSRAVTHCETLPSPDLLIIEGVVALRALERARLPHACKVYLQASLACIEGWYIERYRSVRRDGSDPTSLEARARAVWQQTNLPNLLEHISPGRCTADLVVHKRADHSIEKIDLRDQSLPGASDARVRCPASACGS